MRRSFVFAAALVCALQVSPQPSGGQEPLTVFAAASLTDAMTEAGNAYREKSGVLLRFSFASSSTLARQIEAGAPADIFASANEQWMDYLEERGLIAAKTRTSPIANRLALVAPKATEPVQATVNAALDLPGLLGAGERLAVGDPAHVPAGIYARQALEDLGYWVELEPRLARADNVRAALALVERGETPLGIAYATDARIAEGVAVLGLFPETSHDPISYPFALTAETERAEARDFLAFLTGDEGLAIFKRFGFERAEWPG